MPDLRSLHLGREPHPVPALPLTPAAKRVHVAPRLEEAPCVRRPIPAVKDVSIEEIGTVYEPEWYHKFYYEIRVSFLWTTPLDIESADEGLMRDASFLARVCAQLISSDEWINYWRIPHQAVWSESEGAPEHSVAITRMNAGDFSRRWEISEIGGWIVAGKAVSTVQRPAIRRPEKGNQFVRSRQAGRK